MIFEKYNLEIPLKNKIDISNIETNKQGLNLDDETEITNDLPFKGNEDFNSLNNDEVEKSIGVDDNEDDVKNTKISDDVETDKTDVENDEKKEIESLTGKMGQALREYDKTKGVDGTLSKYVLNSILSAINTNDISDGVKKDIIKKLDINN